MVDKLPHQQLGEDGRRSYSLLQLERRSSSSSSSGGGTAAAGNGRRDDQHRRQESKYKGVRKRSWGKYVSEIREPNKRSRIWLGSFDTAEMAARAYDAAVLCLRGPNSNFNFPEFVPCLPRPLPTTNKEIQALASLAARQARFHSITAAAGAAANPARTHSFAAGSAAANPISGRISSSSSSFPRAHHCGGAENSAVPCPDVASGVSGGGASTASVAALVAAPSSSRSTTTWNETLPVHMVGSDIPLWVDAPVEDATGLDLWTYPEFPCT